MSENSFTDQDGDTFEVAEEVGGSDVLDLTVTFPGATEPDYVLSFYKADAAKIIALIAEAAAIKPTWEAVNAQIDSLLDPNEPTEDMGQ